MALLTADDVLNKKFQPTKFREGYDQDEVDDFLDEVVNTLSSLQNENEELKAKLAAAERRVTELSSGQDAAAVVAEPGPAPAVEETPEPEPTPDPEPEPTPEVAATFAPAAPAATTASADDAPTSAAGMLALAQKVHDEYVSNGKAEGDRILHEAKTEADRIVREAEDTHNRTLAQLEQERSLLERKIDELRVFERDYRTRLKSYLESLLGDVEGRGNVSGRGEQNAPQFGH